MLKGVKEKKGLKVNSYTMWNSLTFSQVSVPLGDMICTNPPKTGRKQGERGREKKHKRKKRKRKPKNPIYNTKKLVSSPETHTHQHGSTDFPSFPLFTA